MRISDQSRTHFDRAKIKLTGHFDRRPIGRYFEPNSHYRLTFDLENKTKFPKRTF